MQDNFKGTKGAITLKGAPLHSGHIFAISQASTMVDHLYVILSFDQKWIDKLDNNDFWGPKLTLKKRLLWLKRAFQYLDHITILHVDETEMKGYPEGVEEWTSEVSQTLLYDYGIHQLDKWFSSEHEYTWWIEKYFNCKNHVIDSDRKTFPISATQIRENPYDNWKFLPSIVRKELLLKVAIIGTESSAKSTLTKYLAKSFNTSWVEEYGRNYCLNEMCGDESLLSFEDYGTIASNRFYQEQQAEATANQILFCDTNAFVTQYYCFLYEGKFNPLVDGFIKTEEYDLVIHLDDNVEWVDDGLRINSNRESSSEVFEALMAKYKIKENDNYHFITGNYRSRFEQAMMLVQDKINQTKLK